MVAVCREQWHGVLWRRRHDRNSASGAAAARADRWPAGVLAGRGCGHAVAEHDAQFVAAGRSGVCIDQVWSLGFWIQAACRVLAAAFDRSLRHYACVDACWQRRSHHQARHHTRLCCALHRLHHFEHATGHVVATRETIPPTLEFLRRFLPLLEQPLNSTTPTTTTTDST